MQISIIKQLAENYNLEQLREAEEALLNEQEPAIEIAGSDECERLTHALGAIELLELHQKTGMELRQCIREFSQRVRNSIS